MATVVKIASDSLEYVYVEVQQRTPAGTTQSLVDHAVDLAFMAHGEPITGDWHVAAWVPDNEAEGRNVARLLIGPGGPPGTLVLPEGKYFAFARVHQDPELPVIKTGEQIWIT
jgi:hypothetical protein